MEVYFKNALKVSSGAQARVSGHLQVLKLQKEATAIQKYNHKNKKFMKDDNKLCIAEY